MVKTHEEAAKIKKDESKAVKVAESITKEGECTCEQKCIRQSNGQEEDKDSPKESIKSTKEQLIEFSDAYPGIEPLSLYFDKEFMEYAKTTTKPLVSAYKSYMEKKGGGEQEHLRDVSDSGSGGDGGDESGGSGGEEHLKIGVSTGSVRSKGRASHEAYFSRDEVMAMSREQIKKNLSKVQKSMAQWSV